MRIAVISDLHGNSVALDHVLSELNFMQVDHLVNLGDVATMGPDPQGVVDRIESLTRAGQCINILGNHDEFMVDLNQVHEYSKTPVVVRSVEWCYQKLTPAQRGFFSSFQRQAEHQVGSKRVRYFHGSPHSHSEDITGNMSPAKLEQLVGDVEGEVLVFGHTHLQMLLQHHGRYLVNPGSLGSPFKDIFFCEAPTVFPYAEYAIVEVTPHRTEVSLRRTQPDPARLFKMIDESEYPLKEFIRAQYQKAFSEGLAS